MLHYRLRTSTVAVHQEATRSVAIIIPSGSILKVPDAFVNSAQSVDVEWDGKSVQMFAIDLRARGELVRARSMRACDA